LTGGGAFRGRESTGKDREEKRRLGTCATHEKRPIKEWSMGGKKLGPLSVKKTQEERDVAKKN